MRPVASPGAWLVFMWCCTHSHTHTTAGDATQYGVVFVSYSTRGESGSPRCSVTTVLSEQCTTIVSTLRPTALTIAACLTAGHVDGIYRCGWGTWGAVNRRAGRGMNWASSEHSMHDNVTTAADGNMHSPLAKGRRRQCEMAYTGMDLRLFLVSEGEGTITEGSVCKSMTCDCGAGR